MRQQVSGWRYIKRAIRDAMIYGTVRCGLDAEVSFAR